MKNWLFGILLVCSFSLLGLSIFNLTSGQETRKQQMLNAVIKHAEECYFEGQKDALEGDIRIKQVNDSCWVWTKSPWDEGRKAIFNPCENEKILVD
jgi:hypothetical protein